MKKHKLITNYLKRITKYKKYVKYSLIILLAGFFAWYSFSLLRFYTSFEDSHLRTLNTTNCTLSGGVDFFSSRKSNYWWFSREYDCKKHYIDEENTSIKYEKGLLLTKFKPLEILAYPKMDLTKFLTIKQNLPMTIFVRCYNGKTREARVDGLMNSEFIDHEANLGSSAIKTCHNLSGDLHHFVESDNSSSLIIVLN